MVLLLRCPLMVTLGTGLLIPAHLVDSASWGSLVGRHQGKVRPHLSSFAVLWMVGMLKCDPGS